MDSNTSPRPGPLDDNTLLAALEASVVPELLSRKLASDSVRVWIPGCSTGELAFAVANLFYTLAYKRLDPPGLQFFATDSAPETIQAARREFQFNPPPFAGSPNQHPQRSPAIQLHQGTLGAVRRLITFAGHDILRDPPFAKLDLIVCADLLAMLPAQAHKEVLNKFRWGLGPGGYLLLGGQIDSAELSKLFIPLSQEPALFQRRGHSSFDTVWQPGALLRARSADDSLQVVNDQLLAMNQELRRKFSRLLNTNDDLLNLLRATNLATIFLDRDLRIMRFTAAAQQVFNLTSSDQGRPLAHITHALAYPELIADAAGVVANLQSVEREVSSAEGCWYLTRLHPYRTGDERVIGVVLTWLDITARVQAEAELRRIRKELEQRVWERTEELSTANSQLQIEMAEREHLEQERAELLRKLVISQEDERRRVARELHDQLGQSVAALGLGLGILANQALDSELHKRTLATLQQLTAQIDQDMSRLAMDLRPAALDDLGLILALQNHIEHWSANTGIAAEFQTFGSATIRLSFEIESVIYRVIQEALTNVLKHASARQVSVIVESRRDQVQVIVEDNGRGFDTQALERAPNVRQHLGLVGMRERIALVGGKMNIESARGAGTTLFIQLPIAAESLKEPSDQ